MFGAIQFVAFGSVSLLATPLIDHYHAKQPLSAILSLSAIFLGLISVLIPWEKLDHRVNLVVSIVAFGILGAFSWGIGDAYFMLPPLYVMIFLYIGLMQDPRLLIVNMTFAVLSSLPLLQLNDIRHWFGIGIFGNLVGLEIALSLIWLRVNQSRSARLNNWLLDGLSKLGRTSEAIETIDVVASHLAQLFGSNEAIVMIWKKDEVTPTALIESSYLNKISTCWIEDQDAGPTVLDSYISAARRGTPTYEGRSDGKGVGNDNYEARGFAAALYLPLEGGLGVTGIAALYWQRHVKAPDGAAISTAAVLCREAIRAISTQIEKQELGNALRYDELTGLFNRREFFQELESLNNRDVLVFLDLDHFKELNDNLGHGEGDRELASFGVSLGGSARENDIACRYGGEEFVVILRQTTVIDALSFLQRFRTEWAKSGRVTFSAGVAAMSGSIPPASVLLAADRAMYLAKARGRNTTVVDVSNPLDAQANIALESSFRVQS